MLLFNKWNQARFLFINLRYLNTQTTRKKRKVWTVEESQRLLELVNVHGQSFRFLESYFPGRTEISLSAKYRYLLQRLPAESGEIVVPERQKRNNWSKEEDLLLLELVQAYGTKWTQISKYIKGRTASNISQRYKNIMKKGFYMSDYHSPYLLPFYKENSENNDRGWTFEEEQKLVNLTNRHGKDWNMIRTKLKTKTEAQCKLRFNRLSQDNKVLDDNRGKIEKLIEQYGIGDFTKIQQELNEPLLNADMLEKYYWTELDPKIKRGDWSEHEIENMVSLLKELDGSFEVVQRRMYTKRSLKDMMDQYDKYSAL